MYSLMSGLYADASFVLFCFWFFLSVSGFAFVYFEDERDAEDAIQNLDNKPFGYDRRRLSVEWAKVQSGFLFIIILLEVPQ